MTTQNNISNNEPQLPVISRKRNKKRRKTTAATLLLPPPPSPSSTHAAQQKNNSPTPSPLKNEAVNHNNHDRSPSPSSTTPTTSVHKTLKTSFKLPLRSPSPSPSPKSSSQSSKSSQSLSKSPSPKLSSSKSMSPPPPPPPPPIPPPPQSPSPVTTTTTKEQQPQQVQQQVQQQQQKPQLIIRSRKNMTRNRKRSYSTMTMTTTMNNNDNNNNDSHVAQVQQQQQQQVQQSEDANEDDAQMTRADDGNVEQQKQKQHKQTPKEQKEKERSKDEKTKGKVENTKIQKSTIRTPKTTTRTRTKATIRAEATKLVHASLLSHLSSPPPHHHFSDISYSNSPTTPFSSVPSLLQKQFDYLSQMLLRSLMCRENSSVLVIGPSGSGKSHLISMVFRHLSYQFEDMVKKRGILGENVNHGGKTSEKSEKLSENGGKIEKNRLYRYQIVRLQGEYITNENSCHTQLRAQLENESHTVFTLKTMKNSKNSKNAKNFDENAENDENDKILNDENDENDNFDDEENENNEGEEDEEVTLTRNLMYLEKKLQQNKQRGICTIFVIDRFELVSIRAKRTLYHMANTSHLSSSSHLVLVGLTTCTNIETMVDKRTLSRMLSRRVFTHLPNRTSQIRDLFRELVQPVLLLSPSTSEKENGEKMGKKLKNGEKEQEQEDDKEMMRMQCRLIRQELWNSFQDCIRTSPNDITDSDDENDDDDDDEDKSFEKKLQWKRLESIYQRSLASSSGISFYLNWLRIVITRLHSAVVTQDDDNSEDDDGKTLSDKNKKKKKNNKKNMKKVIDLMIETYEELTLNPMVHLLSDLTTYELCFLIACKKCEEYGSKSSREFISYNFLIAYGEYCKFISGGASTVHVRDSDLFRDKLMSSLSLSKSIAQTSFEKLLSLGLLKLCGGASSRKMVDNRGKKRDLSTVAVRFNGVHPVEVDRYLKRHKHEINSEIYRWALGG